jgi:hypothetical protein
MTKAYWRSGVLAAAAAATAIGLAGCGGSSPSHVASLSGGTGSGSGGTTTTLPKGNPTQLVDEWAACMRSHGDPDQADPTIDANKVIHITIPANYNSNGPVDLGGDNGSNNPCSAYLNAASTALRGGQAPQKPDPAKLEKFSQCMRAHGIPDFPDPNGNGISLHSEPGSDLNPHLPAFQNASKLCAKKAGVPQFANPGSPQPGMIEATSNGGPQGGPGGNGGAKSNSEISGA